MDNFLTYMLDRFACKKYSEKRISEQDLHQILAYGQLSPTSFGLEGWHFHVITKKELREQLFFSCFEQESVKTAPVTVAITALKAEYYTPTGAFVTQRGMRFPGTLEEFVSDYEGYYEFLRSEGRLDAWSRAQCYIACANMMSGAISLGIQSCAIEGFKEQEVAQIVNINEDMWQVALLITFGYPDEETREKIREPLEQLVTYHV